MVSVFGLPCAQKSFWANTKSNSSCAYAALRTHHMTAYINGNNSCSAHVIARCSRSWIHTYTQKLNTICINNILRCTNTHLHMQHKLFFLRLQEAHTHTHTGAQKAMRLLLSTQFLGIRATLTGTLSSAFPQVNTCYKWIQVHMVGLMLLYCLPPFSYLHCNKYLYVLCAKRKFWYWLKAA